MSWQRQLLQPPSLARRQLKLTFNFAAASMLLLLLLLLPGNNVSTLSTADCLSVFSLANKKRANASSLGTATAARAAQTADDPLISSS